MSSFPCSLPEVGQTGPSNGMRVGVGPWVRLERGLGGLPTPLVVPFAGIMPGPPAFAPNTSEVTGSFSSFCIMFMICPNCTCVQLLYFLKEYLPALCLSCVTQDLQSLLRHAGSLVAACELLL